MGQSSVTWVDHMKHSIQHSSIINSGGLTPLREVTITRLHGSKLCYWSRPHEAITSLHISYSTICRIILVFWLSKSLVSGSTAIRIVIHSAEVVHFTHTPCTLKRLACQGIQRGCNDKAFTLLSNCHNPGGGSGHRGRWLYPLGGTPMGEYGLSVQAHLVGLKQEVHLAANS